MRYLQYRLLEIILNKLLNILGILVYNTRISNVNISLEEIYLRIYILCI